MGHNWSNAHRDAKPPGWQLLRKRILERDNHLCRIRFPGYCTRHARVVDHVNNDRNDNRPENLQAACAECNDRKNILTRPAPKRVSERRPAEEHPGFIK